MTQSSLIEGNILFAAADKAVRETASRWLSFSPSLAEWVWHVGTAAAPLLVACGAASHGLASITTHVVHGRIAKGSAYRAWMPFEGGSRFVLLHALAWTLFGLESDVLVAVSARPLTKVAGLPASLGFCGFVANVVLIAALDQFETPIPSSIQRFSPRGYFGILRGGAERVVAALFVCLSALGFALGASTRWSRRARAPAAYVMAMVLSHLAPPLAHAGGARTIKGFTLIMVGEGGPSFVIAQGCGWMLFAFSVLASIITAANPRVWNPGSRDNNYGTLMRAAAPLAVLSSGLLVASTGLFDSDYARGGPKSASANFGTTDDEFGEIPGLAHVPSATSAVTKQTAYQRGTGLKDFQAAGLSAIQPVHSSLRSESVRSRDVAASDSPTSKLWRLRCDVGSIIPRAANRPRHPPTSARVPRRRTRKQERSLAAARALATRAEGRKASAELARLRGLAETSAVIALLKEAEDALSKELASKVDVVLDTQEDEDDSEEEDDDSLHGATDFGAEAFSPSSVAAFCDKFRYDEPSIDATYSLATAARFRGNHRRRTGQPISSVGPVVGCHHHQTYKRLVLARDLDATSSPFASRDRALGFIFDAVSLFAAPLASLAGIALFAGADFLGGDQDVFQPGQNSRRTVLSPVLAFCAFAATLASAPLQFRLERRFSTQGGATLSHRRFVALRLVALAAWSFAVLVALAALIRYTACNGCALALSIGRRVGKSVVHSPLGACGWGGVAMQLAVLVCAPPADSLEAAVDLMNRRRQEKSNQTQRLASSKHRWHLGAFTCAPKVLSLLPDDAWRMIEDYTAAADLVALSGASKRIPWCVAYTRAARWRRLFATRSENTFESFAAAKPSLAHSEFGNDGRQTNRTIAPQRDLRRTAFIPPPDNAFAGTRGPLRLFVQAIDAYRVLWRGLEVALGPPESHRSFERFFDSTIGESPHSSATTRREWRRRIYAVLATRSRAFAWKLACVLHERGAPLVRCTLCGEVDLGDASKEFIAPCQGCGIASCAHRYCVERDLGINVYSSASRDIFWGTFSAPLTAASQNEPRFTCRACGRNLDASVRAPRGPLELFTILVQDCRRVSAVLAKCFVKWAIAVTIMTAFEQPWALRGRWFESLQFRADFEMLCSFYRPVLDTVSRRPTFTWYLLQQTILSEIFFSRRFSSIVTRLWTLATRNGVRFYLRLYFFFVVSSTVIALSFSPILRALSTSTHPLRTMLVSCFAGKLAVAAIICLSYVYSI